LIAPFVCANNESLAGIFPGGHVFASLSRDRQSPDGKSLADFIEPTAIGAVGSAFN
jgi:hypothetical protein